MKKLFLVLSLATALLASCCNNNQQGAQKCDGKHEHKCEQKCEGHNHEACNHDHQNCEMKQACTKQCDSIKPCEQKCEKPCEKKCEKPCEKAQNCEVKAECQAKHEACQHQHQHEGCNHQHEVAE